MNRNHPVVRRLGERKPVSRRRILWSRLRSKLNSLSPFRLLCSGWALLLTLLQEFRSFCFRISELLQKRSIGRYPLGLVCVSCRTIPQGCKLTRAYILCMQQLHNRRPWLSYSDDHLVAEGWSMAIQLMLDILRCDNTRDLFVDPSLEESRLQQLTQQDPKCDLSALLPLPESRAKFDGLGKSCTKRNIESRQPLNSPTF